jgi:nucleoside-diphosphate-sugar epimerase
MKCCFIGSNGFLATAFGKNLSQKENISIDVFAKIAPISYSYDNFFKHDFTKENDIEVLLKYDIIFYFIGRGIMSSENTSATDIYLTNAFTPINILVKLEERNFNGCFVTFGSYFEIGYNSKQKKFKEYDVVFSPLKVPTEYCNSKRLLSRYIHSSNQSFKVWHFILPTIYGEGENKNRLIPYIVSAIQANNVINLTSADQVREYLSVDEVPEIINQCLNQNLRSGIYNIEGNEVVSIKNLAVKLVDYLTYPREKLRFGVEKRTDSNMKYLTLDGSKLRALVSYETQKKILNQVKKYLNEV